MIIPFSMGVLKSGTIKIDNEKYFVLFDVYNLLFILFN